MKQSSEQAATSGKEGNRKLFHRGHYNILAASIRRELEKYMGSLGNADKHARNALIDYSLSLARRLEQDNNEFDPLLFLRNCSPDPEQYPILELWADAQ